VAAYCEYSIKLSRFINYEDFLGNLKNSQLLKKDCSTYLLTHWVEASKDTLFGLCYFKLQ
jgi:hypothetical protein